MINKDEVIYRLTVEDIQTVATEIIGRELSDEEINKLVDPIAESISWFEVIENCIKEYLDMNEAVA